MPQVREPGTPCCPLCPTMPQLYGSVMIEVQAAPQAVSPVTERRGGNSWGALQAWSLAVVPACCSRDMKGRQGRASPPRDSPTSQLHCPRAQPRPALHAWPHPPQFCRQGGRHPQLLAPASRLAGGGEQSIIAPLRRGPLSPACKPAHRSSHLCSPARNPKTPRGSRLRRRRRHCLAGGLAPLLPPASSSLQTMLLLGPT